MPGEKSTDAEVTARVNQICMMMVKGIVRKSDILQNVAKMNALPEKQKKKLGWIDIEKSDRMIDEYIRRAKEEFKKIQTEDIGDMKAMVQAQLMDLYREARANKHLQTANNIMKNIIYLNNLGGSNFMIGNIDLNKFDIPKTEEQQREFEKKMVNLFGVDFFNDFTGKD